jgi:hypothetical protein
MTMYEEDTTAAETRWYSHSAEDVVARLDIDRD